VTPPLRIAVLADDLIWSTRLVSILRAAGTEPVPTRTLAEFERATADGAIVDLTARAYDGIAAVRSAHGAGRSVACIAQHDDAELRREALAAGANAVYPYRTLHEKGAAALARWLGEIRPAVTT
jgi:DNA-binding NarL/FixJ family response regulator